MHTAISEPISVGAVFSSGKVTPRFFIWKQKKYLIERITYFWRSKTGSFSILHFAVTSNGSVYELSYNLETSNWRLEKIYVE